MRDTAGDLFHLHDLCIIQRLWSARVQHAQRAQSEILGIDHRKARIAGALLQTLHMRVVFPGRILDHVFHQQGFGVQQHIGAYVEFTALRLRPDNEVITASLGDRAFHLAIIQAESGCLETSDVLCQITVDLKQVRVGRIDQTGFHNRLRAQFLVVRAGR